MSNCCSNQNSEKRGCEKKSLPQKFTCPENEQEYIKVDIKTILQHVKFPWEHKLDEQKYYFCDDPNCDVVYFGIEGSVINKSQLRTVVGKKEKDENALVCYCFGVNKALAAQNTEIKTYITQQIKKKNCACEVRNPSGRCCLKDFPKQVQ
ncbi:MAG: hypothetical protein KAT06_00665 [Gammaproteobacteria bacterium]|nr:hypothetical protein [Gammaproteobacteria bacterium]